MKKILLSIILCIIFGTSCADLDVPPKNIIGGDDVFTSETGITAYMAKLYNEIRFDDFKSNRDNHNYANGFFSNSLVTGEALLCANDMLWDNPSGDWFTDWNYGAVRNVNVLFEELEKNKDSFTEDKIKAWTGEAYCVRAFYYFSMVKRYGAVPIIKEVQHYPEQSIEELQVPRDSEQAVYDFIAEDLDEAIKLLTESTINLGSGRINVDVAYALKSRAMLYAGSIAQYGQIQLDGKLGIPKDQAKIYYDASHKASLALEGKYSLYEKYADKSENYWKLFLDKQSSENIFTRQFIVPESAHSYDLLLIPYQMRGAAGYSSRLNPTLEFVEMFDDVDGNAGTLKIGTTANPIRFEKRLDLFANAEPRLRGTVIFPGDMFKGELIDVQKGIYESYPGKVHVTSDFTSLYNKEKAIQGKSGMGHNETTSTGFYIRKYLDPELSIDLVQFERSTQRWIAMRYAEILLNRAEAAFQLDKTDDALKCINQIRARAGAKEYTKAQLTAALIQKERRMELAFESHTYWDLRRWRIFDKEMSNKQYTALTPYYVFDESKYIYLKEGVGPTYTFDVKVYYNKISDDEIKKNEKLSPNNPGY